MSDIAKQIAGAVDRHVMRRWRRVRPRPVDRFLARLSSAGEHSQLWWAFAALAAIFGGQRGRRAARNGLLAVGFASATVNGPLKLWVHRRRPTPHRVLRRVPRSWSFPSGHAASAFAFATAATRETPEAGPLLVPLAGAMAYSRVYLGVHYPSDVVAGAMFGAAIGIAARPAARKLGIDKDVTVDRGTIPALPSEAVLVGSRHSGRSRHLARARRRIDQLGIAVAEQLDIEDVERLPQLLRTAGGEPRLVIAAGGDGTVGSVAECVANTDNTLAILPLGTGNDFARALGIPMSPRSAAQLLATGQVTNVDLGRLSCPEAPARYFAHAATSGVNVNFAKLATSASLRARLGRLTYLVAAAYAARHRAPFRCTLRHDGTMQKLSLLELAVINAPVMGGSLGLSVSVPQSRPDDGLLAVIAVEEIPALNVLIAGLFLLFRIRRPVTGVHAMQVRSIGVDSGSAISVTLDGELVGRLPGEFDVLPGALHVITPRGS